MPKSTHTLLIRISAFTLFALLSASLLTPRGAYALAPDGQIFISAAQNNGNTATCNPFGVAGECYTNLQDAIDDAMSGATIEVGNGVFEAPSTDGFYVDKSVTIVGNSRDNVTLLAAPSATNVLQLEAQNITISSLIINGDNNGNSAYGITSLTSAPGTNVNGFTLTNVRIQNIASGGLTLANDSGVALTDISITNNEFLDYGGASAYGIEVVNADANVTIQGNLFNNIYRGVHVYTGSGVFINNNTFTYVINAILYENPTNANPSSFEGNNINNASGANSVGIRIVNQDQNIALANNTIDGFDVAVSFEENVAGLGSYAGQLLFLRNHFNNNGVGLDFTKTPGLGVTTNIQIGRNGDSNYFAGNNVDVRLNTGMDDNITATYNSWSGGHLFTGIEAKIYHKGISPTGQDLSDSNDNAALGRVNYDLPIDAVESFDFLYPYAEHPYVFFNAADTTLKLKSTAVWEPYGVTTVNYRYGSKNNAAQDTCEELYALPTNGAYNLGNGVDIGNNQFALDVDITGFAEDRYVLCAYMLPASGMPRPAYDPAHGASSELYIDRTAPTSPTTVGWTTASIPNNLFTIANNPSYRTCGAWVNRDHVQNGVNIWDMSNDEVSGIANYQYQVYSEDYGPHILSFLTNTGTSNYFHLPLEITGEDDGYYYIRARAVDYAYNTGNWSQQDSNHLTWCEFRLDTVLPTLSIPNYLVAEGTSGVTLTATAADVNGITYYHWDLDGNGTFETDTGTTNTVQMPAFNIRNGDSTVSAKVQVSDPAGNVSEATSTVTVSNVTPVLNLSATQAAIVGQPVSFTASFTDPGAEPNWNVTVQYGDGQINSLQVSNPGIINISNHTYTAVGTYQVQVTVDDSTTPVTQTGTVTVYADASTVIGVGISYSPGSPLTGNQVGFTANVSNPNDLTLTNYTWNFGDGGTANTANATHTYTSAGTYTVTLGVTTATPEVFLASATITVGSPTPPPVVVQSSSTAAGGTGTTATTSSNSGSIGGQSNTLIAVDAGADQSVVAGQVMSASGTITGTSVPVTFTWDFGDNTGTATGQNVTHIYTTAGTYTVRMTVGGLFVPFSDTFTVTVRPNTPRQVLGESTGNGGYYGNVTTGGTSANAVRGLGDYLPAILVLGASLMSFWGFLVVWKKMRDEEGEPAVAVAAAQTVRSARF